ncbi:hypothetical protein [Alloprevotella tannerae]|uniref:hypothetical protein n=1 Tax=Alloprevotella tannerae TaxID=76122 RepID=UPI0025CE4AA9|nr:hypothetical protein [Alloprevotella tannerae]
MARFFWGHFPLLRIYSIPRKQMALCNDCIANDARLMRYQTHRPRPATPPLNAFRRK